MTDQGDGKVMEVLKEFLEDVFGEGHSYSIYDGETYGNGNMTLIGALGDVAEFTATLSSDETAILISLLFLQHNVMFSTQYVQTIIHALLVHLDHHCIFLS